MHELSVWVFKPDLCKIRNLLQRVPMRVAMTSSEQNTSRLPEEDSSDMDSDTDNEDSQIDIDSQISTSIRSSKSAKKRLCVIVASIQTLSYGPQLQERIFFFPLYEVFFDINLGRSRTRDPKRHQETKLHKHTEKDGMDVLPLQSYFGPIREESVIRAEVLFAYFLGETIFPFN